MVAKKVFITGSDGFIGSHLVERLVCDGHSVRAVCHYNSFGGKGWLDSIDEKVVTSVDVQLGDIRDGDHMKRLMKGSDTVIHLAALIAIPFSYHSPRSYIDTNVTGTLNVLQAALELGVDRLLHTSTSEVYGTAQFVPITEEHPVVGQSPYAASKIAADQLAHSFYNSFELPVTIIRPFNTYGPRQSMRAIIPTVITQLARGNKSIKLGATTPTRDFSYIDDTILGFCAAINANFIEGLTLNLGSGFEISIKKAVEIIAMHFNTEIKICTENERIRPEKSEVNRLLSCNSRAMDLLNWTPKYTGLDGFERGIKETADWFCFPENLAKYPDSGYII